jgi:MoxR-like ATPase
MDAGGGARPPDRRRLAEVIDYVSEGLVERDAQARCLVLSALAGEHVLFLGPPGTAKSELARRLHRVVGGRYFERLLTRFTVPEELFGPLSLAALDEGRYERDVRGYLPTASIAFLDEVFKANSAILNALLTLLHEREFDQGAQRIAVPLVSLVGASNEVPDDEALRAFLDRFLFRCSVAAVSDAGFGALLDRVDAPPREGPALAVEELLAAQALAAGVGVSEAVRQALLELRVFLREKAIEVSDRRWVRLVRALRIAAGTSGRDTVALEDLPLLDVLVAERAEQAALVREWVAERLGAAGDVQPERLGRVVEAFERQLELESSAAELAFDDSGKLALVQSVGGVEGEVLSAGGAPRLSAFSRRKRYSASHIGARIAQIDQVLEEADAFVASAQAHERALAERLEANLWVPRAFARRVGETIAANCVRVVAARDALARVRSQFAALPLAEGDDGVVPPPVEVAA